MFIFQEFIFGTGKTEDVSCDRLLHGGGMAAFLVREIGVETGADHPDKGLALFGENDPAAFYPGQTVIDQVNEAGQFRAEMGLAFAVSSLP